MSREDKENQHAGADDKAEPPTMTYEEFLKTQVLF